jgi:SAM-dependent MidA family methyltransferase
VDELTPAGRVIAEEIERDGPLPFSRFMEIALYHPEHGYYRRPRDPFGKHGDFYTAEQLQPVFGRLIASTLRMLTADLALEEPATVVEMGAGRREMAEHLAGFHYIGVDIDDGRMPERFSGIVFSNEFFDALPVDLVVTDGDRTYERRVSFAEGRFVWDDTRRSSARPDAAVRMRELQHHRLDWLRRIAERLERGYILTIDYGYTHRELVRFPEGTLMSYRRHRASEDVLARPGEQDITAHADFTALRDYGEALGLGTVRFESLASALLRAGEPDNFAAALQAPFENEAQRLRMQLKSLLFGMGETFRVLLQRR